MEGSSNVETVITPNSGWGSLSLQELSNYRDLFRYLAWRNIAVQYKQTFFGVFWALLQPLASSGIFTVFLGTLRSGSL